MPLKGSFNTDSKPTKKETKPVQTQTKSEQEDPCVNVKHDINKFGVTYNKINDPSKMYGEDNTQDCCLSPEQMDANFNFLHGDDIKNGKFDPDKEMLVLDRHFAGKDMAKYGKSHPAIGPVKIPTKHILSGTTFDGEEGKLHIKFNGTDTEIPGFNDYCDDLAEKIHEIQEQIARNTTHAVLSITRDKSNTTIGFKGEPNEITIVSNLETVTGVKPENYISNTIESNGEIIGSNTDTDRLEIEYEVDDDTTFSTVIVYPIDEDNSVEFFTKKTFKTYNRIYLGTIQDGTGDENLEPYPIPRSSAKNNFYLIELPEDLNEYYLTFMIPDDLYQLDRASYNFFYNGYGIAFQENEFGEKKIDGVTYHVFESESRYQRDDENEGVFNIEIR